MKILLDTNLLLRMAQPGHPHCILAQRAVVAVTAANQRPCVVPQVVYEFWVAATRPTDVNGLGMDCPSAAAALEDLWPVVRLLRDERGVYDHWRQLIVQHQVRGKPAHDARLVAAMQRHGLTNILTFNADDFRRFAGINVHAPSDILAGRLPTTSVAE